MNKLTKKGLSATVAFALMFATSVNVIAQEKIVASTDNAEVTKSTGTTTLVGIQNSEGTFEIKKAGEGINVKGKQPVTKSEKAVLLQLWNFVGPQGAGAEDPTDPTQYEPASGSSSCDSGTKVCQINAPEDPDSPLGAPQPDMEAIVTNNQSVEQRIDAVFSSQGTNETLLSYKSSL